MARRKLDHRGIRFGVTRNAEGYRWQEVPVSRNGKLTTEEVLAPSNHTRHTDSGAIAISAYTETKSRMGLDVARKAFNRFRRLADSIAAFGPTQEFTRVDEFGNMAVFPAGLGNQLTSDPDESKAKVVEFANEFGTLWGDDDPRPLRDWQKEASTFLALHDVARILKPGADSAEFERRVIAPRDNWPEFQYNSGRPFVGLMTIAREGQVVESRRDINAVPEVRDYFEIARVGGPKVQARMLLSRQINRKLSAGLSFSASLTDAEYAVVSPHHLLHLLYLRLWMDTVDSDELERQVTCLNCNRPISGRKSRRYCSDSCRWEYNNRLRAIKAG